MAFRQSKDPEAATDVERPVGEHRAEQKSKVESPLNILFSVSVLLWALLVICYRVESSTSEKPKPDTHERVTVGYRVLDSISGFDSGSSTNLTSKQPLDSVAQKLIQEIRDEGAHPDDVLLLLGSADCTAIRKAHDLSNQQLARNRATTVANIIEQRNIFASNHVAAKSLYQSEKCTGSSDLRAVSPVLIKAETSRAETQ